MVHMLLHLVQAYGDLAILLAVLIESLGVPVPGETALLIGAAFAATGRLSLPGVIASAIGGAILGDAIGYWIGRLGGMALVRRLGRRLHVKESTLQMAQGFYQRHGGKTVFFGRFIAVLRTWAALLAGVGRMNVVRFTAYNVSGGICWAIVVGSLGYWFGRSLPMLHRIVGRVGLLLALLVAVAAGMGVLWRWVERHKDELVRRAAAGWRWVQRRPTLQALARRAPRLWRFLGQSLSPGGYLGLHLTLGLLLSLGALALFAGIADDVTDYEDLARFDQVVADTLHRHATSADVAVFRGVSLLGSVAAISSLGVLVAVGLILGRQYVMAAGWSIALIGGGLLDEGLKQAFKRPRPHFAVPFVSLTSWSFPSGHALGSLIAYGMLAYLLVVLWLRRRPAQIAVVLGAAVLVLVIGFSRLYLGAHYLTDVIGGFAAGMVWLTACITGLEVARRYEQIHGLSSDRVPRKTRPSA